MKKLNLNEMKFVKSNFKNFQNKIVNNDKYEYTFTSGHRFVIHQANEK